MVGIALTNFRGRIPRRSNRLLPDNYATYASDVKLYSGELRGMRSPVLVHDFNDGQDFKKAFRLRRADGTEVYYRTSNGEFELLRSPLINDAFDRWYQFEPGEPPKVITFTEVLNGNPASNLALPKPDNAPVLSATDGTDISEERAYVYTYVTDWGEETEPSPPSVVKVTTDGSVDLSGFYNSPAPSVSGRTLSFVRIYRTVTGSNSTRFHFVADVNYGDATYTDNTPKSEVALNDLLTRYHEAPPDGLQGARPHPSGALVAFKDRDVYFSEPYLPHSWPSKWRLSLPDPIVALEVVNQEVVVLTTGRPVVLYGANPESIGMLVMPNPVPCYGYNSVVSTPMGVFFASRDGLARITPNGVSIATEPLMTKEEWQQDYFHEDLYAVYYDGKYMAVGYGETEGFVFEMSGGEPSIFSVTGLPAGTTTFFKDTYNGRVLMGYTDQIWEWDSHTGKEVPYKWTSKEFYLEDPVDFWAIQVELEEQVDLWVSADSPMYSPSLTYAGSIDLAKEVLFRAWGDGQLVYEGVIPNREQRNMPGGDKATVWQFEIEGQCRVHRVTITETGKGQRRG